MLFRSQSAVSGVVARLEEALGTRLFDRTTRSVHLTAAGQVFVEQARLLNAQTQEAVQRVQHITQIQSGKVSLAALPSLAATVVPRVMARYAEQHPDIALQLHDTLSGPAFDVRSTISRGRWLAKAARATALFLPPLHHSQVGNLRQCSTSGWLASGEKRGNPSAARPWICNCDRMISARWSLFPSATFFGNSSQGVSASKLSGILSSTFSRR